MKAYQNGLLFSSIPTFVCLPLSLCSKWWRLILCKCIFWMNNLWLFWFGYLYLFSDLSWKFICDSTASLAWTQVFDQMQDDKEALPILLISAGGVQNVSSGLHFAILPSVCVLIHSLIWCLCAALVSISISALEAGQSIIHSHLSLIFFVSIAFTLWSFKALLKEYFSSLLICGLFKYFLCPINLSFNHVGFKYNVFSVLLNTTNLGFCLQNNMVEKNLIIFLMAYWR